MEIDIEALLNQKDDFVVEDLDLDDFLNSDEMYTNYFPPNNI